MQHALAKRCTCCALPAVVITPLLSLMQDQVQALNGLASGGVPTTYLSSQQTQTEQRVGAGTQGRMLVESGRLAGPACWAASLALSCRQRSSV